MDRMTTAVRAERDFLGTAYVPADALYGIQTVRALGNSGLGTRTLAEEPLLLTALAHTKAACALANGRFAELTPAISEAIVRSAREVAGGAHRAHFPLELVQGGGGTAVNMMVNEVLANRANLILGGELGTYDPVHPNDHVNRSQSTNDVFPTAMAIAAYRALTETVESLRTVASSLDATAARYADLEHLGRTCLQDAVPLPIAAVHGAHAHAVRRAADDVERAARPLLAVPLGGTAVGTGLGAPPGFGESATDMLAAETGLEITPSPNPYDGLASLEPFGRAADALARAARVLGRTAGDLRMLASGPVGGLGEIALPPVQAGSSIMPGKVNPVLPELVMQTQFLLSGIAHTVAAASGTPELEVTPMGPVAVEELLRGTRMLTKAATLFAQRCIDGVEWVPDRVASNLTGSYEQAVRDVADDGYDRIALARHATSHNGRLTKETQP
ncbi:lyase family protein [Solicola gregarius]|uniref:Lyase family protein n=1 Tax=Solicola gregarius TaxID=2908642 RepID=A0AA46TLR6_9ACTN|nr:lyase family protein [Solicola gregarius]UYM07264.1 lyase family protein [Solicola gregarius]